MALQSVWGKGWPYDILLINVTGACVLALITTLADATFLVGPTRRLFLNVGFLGAYTTFSSLALGDVLLLTGREWGPAVLYLGISLVGGMLAVVIGDLLGQTLLRVCRPIQKSGKVERAGTFGEELLPADAAASPEHLDIADDLLVSADDQNKNKHLPTSVRKRRAENEQGPRQERSHRQHDE
jgi:CrcB protein